MSVPYSPRLLHQVQRTITKALALYEYNVHLSESLYGILHGLEVTVRNAEHQALTEGYGTPAWYDQAPLSPHWKNRVSEAKKKYGATAKPEKVVVELTFGFWADLLHHGNHRSLWVGKKLHTAFPNAKLKMGVIHTRLKSIQQLRNRISHHEPVLTSHNKLYNGFAFLTLPEVMECMEWVCQDTALWIRVHFRHNEAERILREVATTGITL